MFNDRIKKLNNIDNYDGDFILYWMQHSQRVEYNHALSYSIHMANNQQKPLIVCFVLNEEFPQGNERNFTFMLEGLKEVSNKLKSIGIPFIILKGDPIKKILDLSYKASVIITDRGYLRIEKYWREELSKNLQKSFIQIESDVVIPVDVLSNKEEYSAATIRRKINKLIVNYDKEFKNIEYEIQSENYIAISNEVDIDDIKIVISDLSIDKTVKKSNCYKGGYSQAKEKLEEFMNHKLKFYGEFKNDPSRDLLSGLSPYLHFGQISPLEILVALRNTPIAEKGSFLEELIVRRELSINFVSYNKNYDNVNSIPVWAKTSLLFHNKDKRPYVYSLNQLEHGLTHDKY